MDEQMTPQPPPIVQPAPAPALAQPAQAPVQPQQKNVIPILIAVAVTAVLLTAVFYVMSQSKPQQTAVVQTPTPTPIATPTPIRQPSAIASDPQFIQFSAAVATLSAAISGYNQADPSLTPPTLDLPLGFSQ